MTEKLCALHRQCLRILAGYRWPKRICNEALYRLTKSRPLSIDIQQSDYASMGTAFVCLLTHQHSWPCLQLLAPTSQKQMRQTTQVLAKHIENRHGQVGLNMQKMKNYASMQQININGQRQSSTYAQHR